MCEHIRRCEQWGEPNSHEQFATRKRSWPDSNRNGGAIVTSRFAKFSILLLLDVSLASRIFINYKSLNLALCSMYSAWSRNKTLRKHFPFSTVIFSQFLSLYCGLFSISNLYFRWEANKRWQWEQQQQLKVFQTFSWSQMFKMPSSAELPKTDDLSGDHWRQMQNFQISIGRNANKHLFSADALLK